MSKIAGYSVLALGILGLGAWGTMKNAHVMEDQITSDATAIAAGSALPLDVTVSGRDIVVSGMVETESVAQSLATQLDAVEGRRVVRTDLTLPEIADPHRIAISKDGDGLSASGMIATEASRDTLAGSFDTSALELRRGAADNWDAAVQAGVSALAPLESGTVDLSGGALSVTGTAKTPTERDAAVAALGAMPTGIQTSHDIQVLDDGQPFTFSANKGTNGLTAAGKVAGDADFGDTGVDMGSLAVSGLDAPAGYHDRIRAGLSGLNALESGDLSVTKDGLTLSGVAQDPAALDAALAALPEADRANTDIALMDDGTPFTFSATKADGVLSAEGKLPRGVDFGDVDLPSDGIRVSGIDGPDGYADRVSSGIAALDKLESGTLEVNADGLRLTGSATSADARDAAIAALPEGVAVEIDAPKPMPQITWTAESGITGIDNADPEQVDALINGTAGDAGTATPALEALAPWMPNIDAFTYGPGGLNVTLAPGVDAEQVRSALGDTIDDGALTFSEPATMPAEGDARTNRFTGVSEEFISGFWMPKMDFQPTLENCRAQSDAILSGGQIRFLSGSAQLDARAAQAINELSAVLRRCAPYVQAGIEIGGHTDSTGDAALNQQLSQDRAQAVADAMAARGISKDVMAVRGYGSDLPIADNATEEGRAANRRTTITWSDVTD